jgi:hypothetical protein
MTAQAFTDYIYYLERAARSASVAEENLRREIAQYFAELERERQFAFRHYNSMQAVARALGEAAIEEEAPVKGRAVFMRELNWAGVTEQQRAVTDRFAPVILAVWKSGSPARGRQTGDCEVENAPGNPGALTHTARPFGDKENLNGQWQGNPK